MCGLLLNSPLLWWLIVPLSCVDQTAQGRQCPAKEPFKKDRQMDETALDQETMGKLAKPVAFILGADHPTAVALKTAAERGFSQDIKQAQIAFNRMKPADRSTVLDMLED